jgi:hypothetical protein
MWWEGREKIRTGKISLVFQDSKGRELALPEKLVGDLSTPEYEIDGDKVISVETKQDIKTRLGRSTDDGDAIMMAIFDFPPAPARPILPGSTIVRGRY